MKTPPSWQEKGSGTSRWVHTSLHSPSAWAPQENTGQERERLGEEGHGGAASVRGTLRVFTREEAVSLQGLGDALDRVLAMQIPGPLPVFQRETWWGSLRNLNKLL